MRPKNERSYSVIIKYLFQYVTRMTDTLNIFASISNVTFTIVSFINYHEKYYLKKLDVYI